MKLKTRRILLIVCIILFLLLFPLIVLYSFGYGYDLKEKKMVRTGIIYITANPQDNIKIFVNGEEEKKNLSVKGIFKKDYALYNLMPQTYDIRITKDGYSQWEKRLSVAPGLNTYARPLLLSLNPADDLLFEGKNILGWSASLNFKKIAYLKKENEKIIFSIYNTENKTTNAIILNNIEPDFEKTLFQSPDLKANFYWDANSENIIMEIASKISRFFALNTTDNGMSYLGKIQPDAKITNGAWSQNNNLFIFQTDQKELYCANILSDPNKSVKISDNVSGFTAKNNIIYYLDAKNLYLYSFSLDNPTNKKQFSIEPLPIRNIDQESAFTPNVQIIVSNKSDIAIINSNKDLFIVKQNNGAPSYIESDINLAKFSGDGDSLLYNSSFEIYTYSIGDKTKNLITRMAQKMEKVSWYKDYEHIWFINNNIIKNIEIDSRPITNIINFAVFSIPPENFIYNPNSNTIYYDQINGDKTSIRRLMVEN